jgi:uncharacterized protein HemY
MPEKTPRMRQIEAMLADEPNDAFLRYGLAMEYAGQGDDATAVRLLRELISREPYVPAYLQAGQALNRLNRFEEACDVLRQGIAAARVQGTPEALHAAGEMQGLLDSLE